MGDSWIPIVVASVSAFAAIVVAFVPRWAEAREGRRTRYAEAAEALVAWSEFPYRVARRVSDDPEVLAVLARRGHSLRERVAFHETWVTAESKAMGRLYTEVVEGLRTALKPATQLAWVRPPVSGPSGMNLAPLGIDRSALRDLVGRIAIASRWRFGWRRMVEPIVARRNPVFSDPVMPPIDQTDQANT